jgi:lipopolysaccharide transport system ATP-binding protein
MPLALRVESVSKCFRAQRNRPSTVKESLIWWFTGRRSSEEVLWALKDVSFTVGKGRCLGIIGHNGAGKSTLLRLLCGVGRPTSGHIHREGFASGLLELGSGWHPELTGRENLLTAGILNGLTARQVQEEQDNIISFAELEEFIDQPVRTYSTGMYLRLAFSTAIHFDPDVLMIDEVLAVGDSRFQQKCIDRLEAFQKAGKTLVLVSHNTDQIRRLCDEVLVMEQGRVVTHCDSDAAILCYNDLMRQRSEKRAAQISAKGLPNLTVERGTRLGTQEAAITSVRVLDSQDRMTETIQSGDELKIVLEYRLARSLPDFVLLLGIYSETDVKCFETVIQSTSALFGTLGEKGSFSCHIPALPLQAGRYYIVAGLYPTDWSYIYDYHWQMHVLHVMSEKGINPGGVSGVVSVDPVWSITA